MTVTIYHNPKCGTSRNVLAMIQRSGEEPVVIEYLKDPPSRERLKELIAAMGIPSGRSCARGARPTQRSVFPIRNGRTRSSSASWSRIRS